jgi:hypothetical protein
MGNVIDITNRLTQPESIDMMIEEILQITDEILAGLN